MTTTTADKGELLPCPFCGERPTQDDVGSYFVQCPECGVEGPYGSPDAEASAAIAAWNRRPTNEGQDGLTDEEIESIASKCWVTTAVIGGTTTGFAYGQFARAIARHLSSKQAARPGNAVMYDPNDVAFPKGFMPVDAPSQEGGNRG